MKRGLSILLALCMLLLTLPTRVVAEEVPEFRGMNDPSLLPYMEDALYDGLLTALDGGDYAVEDVRAVYISQEYLDELAYNSQANLFFGYTIAELDAQFEGTRYVFTLDEHNETGVKPFEAHEDDTYTRVLKNVAIGAGVILICVTVSVLSAPGAPAVSLIFACAAKTGTALAMKGGAMGFLTAGVLEYMQTGNLEKAFDAGLLKGSESFKWGAIGGSILGGAKETAYLSKLSRKMVISLDDAARIQREKKYSLEFLRALRSMDEYKIYKDSKLMEYKLENGQRVLLPEGFDFDFVDSRTGMTNLELMAKGYNPVDLSGVKYEWHHVGQKTDSPLALLTKAQHHDNHGILHPSGEISEVHTPGNEKAWTQLRKMINRTLSSAGILP
ncbi:MAG: HNH/ENDO VII family nuclease [Clostridia bacterium]|nr:HNH/ENDO VII family nuclease [Clostridia bacterium]